MDRVCSKSPLIFTISASTNKHTHAPRLSVSQPVSQQYVSEYNCVRTTHTVALTRLLLARHVWSSAKLITPLTRDVQSVDEQRLFARDRSALTKRVQIHFQQSSEGRCTKVVLSRDTHKTSCDIRLRGKHPCDSAHTYATIAVDVRYTLHAPQKVTTYSDTSFR